MTKSISLDIKVLELNKIPQEEFFRNEKEWIGFWQYRSQLLIQEANKEEELSKKTRLLGLALIYDKSFQEIAKKCLEEAIEKEEKRQSD